MNATGKMSCKCPICGGEARWSVMKNSGRVCITHGACGVQVFARGDEADELMRDKFIAGGATQAAPNVTNVQEAGEPAPVTYVQDGEGFGVWN
jgi:hypothetical protein